MDESPTVTVHVTLALRQRGRRKVIVAPDEAGHTPLTTQQRPQGVQRKVPPAVRALARALRWRRLLETGAAATVHDIASAENINPSYVSRILRLSLLSPAIVEAVMSEAENAGVAVLDKLMLPFPIDWRRQSSIGCK